jgi:peptidoglycan/xylan/chitin deacetylase (PgdA/CDA1 family)
MDVMAAHQASATVSACGRAVERTPALARDAVARGHEVAAHGWRWESHAHLTKAKEREPPLEKPDCRDGMRAELFRRPALDAERGLGIILHHPE